MYQSLGDFAQLVMLHHDRPQVSRLEQLSQDKQVRPIEVRDEEDGLLSAAQGRPAVRR
jgi:hypothetical protein